MSVAPAPREFASTTEAWIYLKEKAAATKARELRKKMASEIEEIRNRKVKSTIIPVPSDQQETYFEKFECNGIWEQVFKNLMNISDISSACFASKLFHDHLGKRRILMLLSQAFGVLRKHNYLNLKTILTLRLVSESWRLAAEDHFLARADFSQPDWYLHKNEMTELMFINSPNRLFFRRVKDVEVATVVLRNSHSGHCLLKIVEIDVWSGHGHDEMSDQEKGVFFSKLQELFEVQGKHVWSLFFGGRFEYEALRNIVSRMPNLKELCIAGINWRHLRLTEDDERRLCTLFPFPSIPSLKRLTFFWIPEYKLLAKEIILRNPSVKTFSVRYESLRNLEHLFHALENLRLECFDFGLAEDARMHIPSIEPIARMQWPLKVLNLYRGGDDSPPVEIVNASDFFGILNNFNDTLEQVYLDSMVLMGDGRSVVVQYPNLKNVDKVSVVL